MKTNSINHWYAYFKYAVYSFFLVCLISCDSDSTVQDLGNINTADTITIDPMHLSPEVVVAKQVFDSVQFIPLETNNKAVFSKIDQLEIIKDRFVILDKSSNSILTFNKDGKFIFKVGGTSIHQFAVNHHTGNISFQDYSNLQTFTYDSAGKLVNKKPTPLYYTSSAYLDDDKIAYYRAFINDNISKDDTKPLQPKNLLISDGIFNVLEGFFQFDQNKVMAKEMYSPFKTFYRSDTKTIFIHPYNYYVYDISSGEPNAKYRFDFPKENQLPKDFLSSASYYGRRREFLKDNLDRIYDIQNFYEVNDFLTFTLRTANYSDSFLYHKKTKKLISILDLASDKSSCLVPLGDEVLGADKNSIFTTISSKNILKARWDSASKIAEDELPTSLRRFFSSGGNLDNPILIRCFVR